MIRLPCSLPASVRRLCRSAPIALALASVPAAALGQDSADDDGVRFGISIGGVSTVGLLLEYFNGNRSLDLTVGTWSFRDLTLSLVAKEYFGASALRPFVGAGLWMATANPSDGRLGVAVVFRVPVGVDWMMFEDHALGAALNINRALWVRRTDPEDDLPLEGRWVPLPGLYYRFGGR